MAVVARVLICLSLVLGQIGSFAHALSHLEHGHAHAGHGHAVPAAVEAGDDDVEHDHVCDGLHAHADSHSEHGLEPVCELCAAFGSAAVVLPGPRSDALAQPARVPAFVVASAACGRPLLTSALIRAPPAVVA